MRIERFISFLYNSITKPYYISVIHTKNCYTLQSDIPKRMIKYLAIDLANEVKNYSKEENHDNIVILVHNIITRETYIGRLEHILAKTKNENNKKRNIF